MNRMLSTVTTGVFVNEETKEFHIQGKEFSYIFFVLRNGQLGHLYYGKRLPKKASYLDQFYTGAYGNTCTVFEDDETFCLDRIQQEFPSYGTSDYRQPAIEILQKNGSRITNFQYVSHEVTNGKPELGMPATFVERNEDATTLTITLYDEVIEAELKLNYTLFHTSDVLTRNARVENKGATTLTVNRLLSMSVDFPERDYEMMTLTGAWVRERHLQVSPLHHGIQSISSTRGTSSSTANPFFMLKEPTTTEHRGGVYGFNLVYSGNHVGQVEVDPYDHARIQQGMNYFDFSWKLETNESLQSPEAVMVYSENGLNGMSQKFHDLYTNHLVSKQWRHKTRPVLINNWEATYFDFNEDKIMELATAAQKVGVELFVLDDGWFGKRNSDKTSLGDWFYNPEKLPQGVKGLCDKINGLGLEFGIWIEPEMISPNSDLFRAHPEWVVSVENRPLTLGRNQCVLDFSNKDVVDYIYGRISEILASANISYVKWDWNRTMTELGSTNLPATRQSEVAHRYILGVYDLYERLTSQFPHILFEGCAAGGSRFDPAMLYYSPQIWTSDDTDAVERLKIQYGTSFAYPLSTMGAHVSAVPNHQVHRTTSLKMRGDVAFFGVLGYELDLTELTEEELADIREQIEFYKEYRKLFLQGDFYRLKSPFEGNETAWSVVAKNQKAAVAGFYQVLARPNVLPPRVKLTNLLPEQEYKLVGTSRVFNGEELMSWGVELSPTLLSEMGILEDVQGDFVSALLIFEAN